MSSLHRGSRLEVPWSPKPTREIPIPIYFSPLFIDNKLTPRYATRMTINRTIITQAFEQLFSWLESGSPTPQTFTVTAHGLDFPITLISIEAASDGDHYRWSWQAEQADQNDGEDPPAYIYTTMLPYVRRVHGRVKDLVEQPKERMYLVWRIFQTEESLSPYIGEDEP